MQSLYMNYKIVSWFPVNADKADAPAEYMQLT